MIGARRFRDEMESFLVMRIEEAETVLADLQNRRASAATDHDHAKALLADRVATARDIEGRVFAAGAANEGDISKLMARKAKADALVAKSEQRVDDLARALGRLPNEIARVSSVLERLRAVSDPAVLDVKAVAAGRRSAEQFAKSRRENEEARRLAGQRAEARKLTTDRDKPTVEAMARRGVAGRGERGSVILGPDVPDALARLKRANKIGDAEIEAAGRYQEDYHFGTDGGSLVSSYDPKGGKSTGGGNRAEHVQVGRLEAFNRYQAARAAIPAEFVAPLEAILFQGVSLDSVPGAASAYSEGSSNRRAASGVLVICGLKRLAEFYNSDFGGRRA